MVDSARRYQAQTRDYLYRCIRQALLAYCLLGALLLLTSFGASPPCVPWHARLTRSAPVRGGTVKRLRARADP